MVEFQMVDLGEEVREAVRRYATARGMSEQAAANTLLKAGLDYARNNRKEKKHGKEEVERNPRNRRAAKAVPHRGGRREGSRDGRARRVRGQRCEA